MSRDVIVGIDPGKTGGVAVLGGGGLMHAGSRMFMLSTGNKREAVNATALRDWLDTHAPLGVGRFVIEQVSAMPRQGVASSFNFGRFAGAVEALAELYAVPVHLVTPAVWKKAMRLDHDKAKALDLARREFGPHDGLWDIKANDGIAEAALLALYWHRHRH